MTDNRNLLELTAAEKQDLERWAQSRTLPAGDVFRARLILALADGQSYREMVRGMRTSAATIARWRRRFEQDRLAGLEGRHRAANLAPPRLRCRRAWCGACNSSRAMEARTGRAVNWRASWG